MSSIDQQRFEDMMMATVPNADLTYEDGAYLDEGVQSSWVGYRALHHSTTLNRENNYEGDQEDAGNTG